MYSTSMWYSWRPEESIEFPASELRDGCDLPDLGAKNQTLLSPLRQQETLLTAELFLLPPCKRQDVTVKSKCSIASDYSYTLHWSHWHKSTTAPVLKKLDDLSKPSADAASGYPLCDSITIT